MQALKLKIEGSYYDSQIYSNRLYLWTLEGSILIVDWLRLLESVSVPDELRFAVHCAFIDSDYLYSKALQPLFQDIEIRRVINKRFEELASYPLEFSKKQIREFVITEQPNPFPFPHADSTIYERNLYVGETGGVVAAACGDTISKNVKTLLDLPVLSLAASYKTLALAGGSEGLFEFSLINDENKKSKKPKLLVKEHSNLARWMFGSIFSSSYFNKGYLADFDLETSSNGKKEVTLRKPLETLSSQQIVQNNSSGEDVIFTWGVQDKICIASNNKIQVVQYNPFKLERRTRFANFGTVDSSRINDDIVSADSALFGYIIELSDGLIVITSDLETIWLDGEPVNWRVFPNSKYYTNQLHVISDDYLCVHSFNQDYFIEQRSKRVGTQHLSVKSIYQTANAEAGIV